MRVIKTLSKQLELAAKGSLFIILMDDDGVGLFTLEWFWSYTQNKAIPWHHYTYNRSPELYAKACNIVESLCLSKV